MEKLLVIAGAALFFNAILALAVVGLGMRFGYLRWGNSTAEQLAKPSASEAAAARPPPRVSTSVNLLGNGGLRLFTPRASSIELIVKLSLFSTTAYIARLVDDSIADEQIIDFSVAASSSPRTTPSVPSQAIAF